MHRVLSLLIVSFLVVSVLGASTAEKKMSSNQSSPSAMVKQGAPAAPAKVVTVEGITEYAIENGLRVLLFPDQTKPTTTVNITYFVGSRHEGYGETGMAHLLEHMEFKGTPKHANPWKLLEDHGAFFNGTTWVDRTNYYEIVPASPENLDFALALEADRMVNSKIAKEDLEKEFSVVRNEFEMGENYPLQILEERMYSSAYLWHNYGKSTIGSKSDIERVPVENLRAFYQKYYQPDNAMLVVAGKFDEARALDLIQKYFAPIPRPSRRLNPTYTVEPVQDGEREVVLRRAGDVAGVGLMYHGLSGSDEKFVAEEAIIDILTNDPAGRLYKALVETGMAARVFGSSYVWAEPGVMQCFAEVRQEKPIEPVRETMIKVIEELARGPIAPEEVERFKGRALKDINLAFNDSQRICVELSEWAAIGDWRMIFLHRDRVKALTVEAVQGVAADFLRASNRTVGMFVPTKTPERSPLPQTVDVAALVKDYEGQETVGAGEEFVATTDNIEKTVIRTSLTNGMKVALLPKKSRGGAVEFMLTLHFGSETTLLGKTIAAALIPDMLMRGTSKHSYQQIKDEFDRLKAQVSFMPGETGSMSVRVTTVKDTLPAVLSLVAEVLEQPTFPADQFEIVRKENLATLEQRLQDPMAQGFSTLNRRIDPWPKENVRYRPSIQERIDRTRTVALADVKEVYGQLLGASFGEVTLVGDIDPAEAKSTLESLLGSWKSPAPFERISRPHQPDVPATEDVIQTPDKQMAVVAVGRPIEVRDDDPEYPALEMINYALGASAKSRLLDRLRQKEGLSYGAFSNISADSIDRNGAFLAGAICAPQNAAKSMQCLQEELQRLVKDGISDAELSDQKKSYQLVFDNQLAQDDYVLQLLNSGLYYNRTLEYYRNLTSKVQQLTSQQIHDALAKHFDLSKLIRVEAGDLKDLASSH